MAEIANINVSTDGGVQPWPMRFCGSFVGRTARKRRIIREPCKHSR